MIRKNFKQLILAIAKPLLWAKYRQVYWDLEVLLSPCCIPTIVFDTDTCATGNTAQGVLFQNVVITDTTLINKTVTAILTSTDNSGGGGVIQQITFNSQGIWTGDLQSSWWNSDGTQTVTLTLIVDGSKVIRVSDAQTINVQNCD